MRSREDPVRILALGAVLMLAAWRTPSQLAPYPDWARSQALIALLGGDREALLPPELLRCHERVRRFLQPCTISQWWAGGCSFMGLVTDRMIAVEPPPAGLDSGLDGVDCLDRANPSWMGPDSAILIIAGRRNGASVIRFAVIRTVKTLEPAPFN